MVEAKEFSSLPANEQMEILNKLNGLLKEHEVDSKIDVTFNGTMKADIKDGYKESGSLIIKGELRGSEEDKRSKITEAAKGIVGDVKFTNNIVCKLGLGDTMTSIPDLTPLTL
jgi:hypothetical protein